VIFQETPCVTRSGDRATGNWQLATGNWQLATATATANGKCKFKREGHVNQTPATQAGSR
jgi:hypothetical protein